VTFLNQTVLHSLRARALVAGILGALAACVLVPCAQLILKIQIGISQFAPAAIGIYLVVVAADLVIRRLRPSWALSSADMIVAYCMILIATLMSSRGLMDRLMPTLVMSNYLNRPEYKWDELVFPHVPNWWVAFNPQDTATQDVSRYYYESLPVGEPLPWSTWLRPLAAWYVFAAALFAAWMCLASIFRRQWVDAEKLTFPLVELPLELSREQTRGRFFRSRLMWMGFAIPAVVFTINGLNKIYPIIPELGLQNNLNSLLVNRPWRDIAFTTIYLSFAAIGFGYFLPTQLLFSLWFFFWFARLEDIVISAFGGSVEAMPMYPTRVHIGYQVMGAYLVLCLYLVRAAWPHLRRVFRRAFLGDPSVDDSNELLSHRRAVFGLIAATAGAIVWLCAGGMSTWLAMLEVCVYLFVVSLVMARSVSEAGMMMCETSFRPLDVVRTFRPLHSLSPRNLTLLAFPDSVFVRDLRGNLFSPFLDALKIADGVHLRKRALFSAMVVAMGIAFVGAAVVHLYIPYTEGMLKLYQYGSGNATMLLRHSVAQIQVADNYDVRLPINFAIGIVLTLFLSIMRARFWWWPFYPIGYALCGSWTMIVFWFPLTLAWIIKTLLLRYAGMDAYRKGRPFFLGMILGEFFMAVLWTILCTATRQEAPFFPWP